MVFQNLNYPAQPLGAGPGGDPCSEKKKKRKKDKHKVIDNIIDLELKTYFETYTLAALNVVRS